MTALMHESHDGHMTLAVPASFELLHFVLTITADRLSESSAPWMHHLDQSSLFRCTYCVPKYIRTYQLCADVALQCLSPLIPHPSSLYPHPSSPLTPHPHLHSSSLTLYTSLLIPHPSSPPTPVTPHSLSLTLTLHPSPFTPHPSPSPFIPHPSHLIPHPHYSSLTLHAIPHHQSSSLSLHPSSPPLSSAYIHHPFFLP